MVGRRTYLVFIKETLIARDIAEIITDFDPDADVICAASLADAQSSLVDARTVEIAFVAGAPSAFLETPLHHSIVARGGRLVLLGLEAEAVGPTSIFDVLTQPFDTSAVMAKLRHHAPRGC